MFARFALALSFCALIFTTATRADAKPKENTLAPAKAATVDNAVKAEMEKQELVGVAVGIIQDGKVVYVQAYGSADAAKRTPVTPERLQLGVELQAAGRGARHATC